MADRSFIAVVVAIALAGCKDRRSPPPPPASTMPPKPPDFPNATEEQLERKARSEARLRDEGMKVNASLPVIADKARAKPRALSRVVDRALALTLVAVKGEGLEQPKVLSFRDELGAAPFLSPKEKSFVDATTVDKQERAQFAWRYECLGVLHWALGRVETLAKPAAIVDAGLMVKLVMRPGAAEYRAAAKLRSIDEILDEADLIYRYDWACVDARVAGKPAPTGIDCEIVVERHHALNWLSGYQDRAWDDVSTDT